MRWSGRDASSASDELRETRENDHVSMARSKVSFHVSIASRRGEVAESRAFRCAVTLNKPCNKIKRANGLQCGGIGVRANKRFKTGRKPGDSGVLRIIRSQSSALVQSHSTSAHGKGKRTSCTDRMHVWPNMKLCWASMTKPKNAARYFDMQHHVS